MSRDPTEIPTARIGRLSRLPVFFALEGKRAVVAGGGQAAAWKVELLSAAGARSTCLRTGNLRRNARARGTHRRGAITLHARRWTRS